MKPPAVRKTSTDEVHRLLTALGLPVYEPEDRPANRTATSGFVAKAWGGQTGGRTVKAAMTVEVGYRFASGLNLTGGELREGAHPAVRQQFARIAAEADQHGYTADWNPNTAQITICRAVRPSTAPANRPATPKTVTAEGAPYDQRPGTTSFHARAHEHAAAALRAAAVRMAQPDPHPTFVVVRCGIPIQAAGTLPRAQEAAITADTEFLPADRPREHRWVTEEENTFTLKTRGPGSARWTKSGYTVVAVPTPASFDPAPALEATELLLAFVDRSARQEVHVTAAGLHSTLGLALRTAAQAHGAAAVALTAGRPDLALDPFADLIETAQRWKQLPDYPGNAVDVLRSILVHATEAAERSVERL
ncbi:hypothetical protein [Kitasatospora sp. NPDC058046]|uniref:hypothetical protein n=1 Tax=Kitasatospora sp. NPDC058046 TaxID=3346312 RepID=UPI0036DC5E0E